MAFFLGAGIPFGVIEDKMFKYVQEAANLLTTNASGFLLFTPVRKSDIFPKFFQEGLLWLILTLND
jgi:hypothetical protein